MQQVDFLPRGHSVVVGVITRFVLSRVFQQLLDYYIIVSLVSLAALSFRVEDSKSQSQIIPSSLVAAQEQTPSPTFDGRLCTALRPSLQACLAVETRKPDA